MSLKTTHVSKMPIPQGTSAPGLSVPKSCFPCVRVCISPAPQLPPAFCCWVLRVPPAPGGGPSVLQGSVTAVPARSPCPVLTCPVLPCPAWAQPGLALLGHWALGRAGLGGAAAGFRAQRKSWDPWWPGWDAWHSPHSPGVVQLFTFS